MSTSKRTDNPAGGQPAHLPVGYTTIPEESAWEVTGDSLCKLKKDSNGYPYPVEVSPTVPHLTHRYVGPDGELIQLTFWRDGGWRDIVVDRRDIADSRKIVGLSAYGFGVNSVNARDVVSYVADVESENEAVIPVTAQTANLGWQHDGTFLYTERDDLLFHPQGDHLADYIEHFKAKGSREAWLDAFRLLDPYPTAKLPVYGSLATPLLRLLRVNSFAIDLSGSTSTGKTTALKFGVSVFASPREHPEGVVQQWNMTPVYIEQVISAHHGLPVAIDETALAKPGVVEQVIHELHQDHGRGRGSPGGGVQRSRSWSTILFSTGEKALTDGTTDGGARGRTVTADGQVLPPRSPELVNRMQEAAHEHYGHVGPEFVERLMGWLEKAGKSDRLRREWRTRVHALQEHAASNVGDRRAANVAVIWLAADMAHGWDVLPGDAPDADFWKSLVVPASGEADDDQPAAALEDVLQWAVANRLKFWKTSHQHAIEPPGGWVGRWEENSRSPAYGISFLPKRLEQLLKEMSYDPGVIIAEWVRKGYLSGGKQSSRTYPVKFRGQTKRLHLIGGSVAFEAEESSEESSNEIESIASEVEAWLRG